MDEQEFKSAFFGSIGLSVHILWMSAKPNCCSVEFLWSTWPLQHSHGPLL